MYKRRRRRTGCNKKGKKKETLSTVQVPSSTTTILSSTSASLPLTESIMSVTDTIESTSPALAPAPIQPAENNKAVGARKRKTMTVLKIVDKTLRGNGGPNLSLVNVKENDNGHVNDMDVDDEFSAEISLNNNNNLPEKLSETRKNGMIRSLVTELKSAKASCKLDAIFPKPTITSSTRDINKGLAISVRVKSEEDLRSTNEDNIRREEARNIRRNSNEPTNPKFTSSHGNRRKVVVESQEVSSYLIKNNNNNNSNKNKRFYSDQWFNQYNKNASNEDESDESSEVGGEHRRSAGSENEDELPFKCGVCSYGSCDQSTLMRHMRTHSGERPFQCQLCFFAFTTKANCERHLRNRHGQIDKDQMRNLVVCVPTSSSESEPETDAAATGNKSHAHAEEMYRNNNNNEYSSHIEGIVMNLTKPGYVPQLQQAHSKATLTYADYEELPLDLSMDAVDLSTKRTIDNGRVDLLRPRPIYPMQEVPNPLLTSPYLRKREPTGHPQLTINPFTAHLRQAADLNGTPPAFSLFPFGAPTGFNPFLLPPPNVDKLIRAVSPSKINPFIVDSPTGSFGSTERSETSVKKEPEESNRAGSNSVSSASPTSNSNKRPAKSNNRDYQKPKQRRYRTERPFACPHCPARFTLRSNMERHGKHQHCGVWQRSPSNRVINRQRNQQASVSSPTLVPPSNFTNGSYGEPREISPKPPKGGNNNVDVRAVIAQQLKRKISNCSLTIKTEPCENGSSSKSGGEASDLASVSQLLKLKSSSFAQYFAEPENGQEDDDYNDNDSDRDESMEGDDGDGRSSIGYEEEEGDEDEEKQDSSGGEKKKSAYSSAPHKISCPHCTRRFPWTSSLRRHLLTHTGQKPYQCLKCPLLFTTKSNCDRHLARKHSNGVVSNSKDNSVVDTEEDDEDEVDDEDGKGNDEPEEKPSHSQDIRTPVRNAKTNPALASTSTTTSSSPGDDVSFRCHLCEASASERDVLLTHMEEEHGETFQLLVSKGALNSQLSENSENEQINNLDITTHRKVICAFCVRRFWSVEDLRRHIRSHSGERPFSCTHCSRRFTLKHSMLRHLKKHSDLNTESDDKKSLIEPLRRKSENSNNV